MQLTGTWRTLRDRKVSAQERKTTTRNRFRSAAFEVRGVHRRRKRFRDSNCVRNQREECTIAGQGSAEL